MLPLQLAETKFKMEVNFTYNYKKIALWVINNVYNLADKSWVLVAPPKYAPGIPNIVSLYRTILETQHPVEKGNPVIDPVIPEEERNNVCKSFELYYAGISLS